MPKIRSYFSVDVYTAGDTLYAKNIDSDYTRQKAENHLQVFTVQSKFGDSSKLDIDFWRDLILVNYRFSSKHLPILRRPLLIYSVDPYNVMQDAHCATPLALQLCIF